MQEGQVCRPLSSLDRLRMRLSVWLYKKKLHYLPNDVETLARLGAAEIHLGRFETGEIHLGSVLNASPDRPAMLVLRGIGLQNLGRLDEALTCYERAIALCPEDEDAIARSNQLKQLARGLVSDVQSIDDKNCLVRGKHGWFFANRFDQYLGNALIRYGEYGEFEHEFLTSLVTVGDGVIEVGANIGTHTVGLAKAVGGNGIVIAIEPQPEVFRILCANLALNSIFNATPLACGCGDHSHTMIVPTLDYSSANWHNSGGGSLASSGKGTPVSVTPLDDLVEDVPNLRLVKIDVEGMEREVLLGARGLMEKYRPLLYVENDRVEKSKALIELIMAAGYRLWWHIPPLYNPDNHFREAQNIYSNIASFNMFCQPRELAEPAITEGLTEITDSDGHPLASQDAG